MKVDRALFFGIYLVLIGVVGCNDADRGSRDALTSTQSQPLALVDGILRYTPRLSKVTLSGSERYCFVVLVSTTGKKLDEEMARAGGEGTMRFSPITGAPVAESRLVDRQTGQTIATRYEVHDTEKNVILDNHDIKLELGHMDGKTTITAAVGVFDSSNGNFPLLRLATPIACIEPPAK